MSNAANQVTAESLYGNNAITSGDALTADEQAILAGAGVEVRDGDDLINVDVEGEELEGADQEPPKVDAEEAPALLPITEQNTDELVMEGLKQRQDAFQEAAAKVAEAGIDPATVVNEFNTAGKLSDETYAALEGAGYPKAAVDEMIADQQAQTQAYYSAVYAHAGGDAGFQRLATFAQTADPAAVAKFNEAIEGGDLATCKEIITALKSKLAAKYGTANKGLKGKPAAPGKPATPKAEPFADRKAMVDAMSDKRYGRDKAYTQSVESRVMASS